MAPDAPEVSFSPPCDGSVHRLGAVVEGGRGHSSGPLGSPLPSTALGVHEASPGLSGIGLYRETKGPERACQESNNQPFKSC